MIFSSPLWVESSLFFLKLIPYLNRRINWYWLAVAGVETKRFQQTYGKYIFSGATPILCYWTVLYSNMYWTVGFFLAFLIMFSIRKRKRRLLKVLMILLSCRISVQSARIKFAKHYCTSAESALQPISTFFFLFFTHDWFLIYQAEFCLRKRANLSELLLQ